MKAFPGLGGALVLLLAAASLQAAAAALLSMVWQEKPDRVLLAGLANLVALSAVTSFAVSRSKEALNWRPRAALGPRFWFGALFAIAGGTIVLGELANAVTAILPLPGDLARLFNELSGGPLAVSLFTLSVVAPLTEETLFRGVILRSFARRWGNGPGLFLSSALFALFHLNLWQAPSAFVAGLFLGWLFLRSGTLVYPLLAHALFNGLPVVLAALGAVVPGYNSPLVPGIVEFQPVWWTALGAAVLAAGLALCRPWAPLSAPPVSDRVSP